MRGNKIKVRVACAQINCAVGDIAGNAEKIACFSRQAREKGADIALFPELALTGYPPEDLLLKASFIADNLAALRLLSGQIRGLTAVIGFVDREGQSVFNAAAVVSEGKIQGVCRKIWLPNYSVFDEKRYFTPGDKPFVFVRGGCVFGLSICEDIWAERGPTPAQVKRGAGCLLSINASPYHAGKSAEREALVCRLAKERKVPVVYVNLVGGQDELIFDGQSLVADAGGKLLSRGKAFGEDLLLTDIEISERGGSAAVVMAEVPGRPEGGELLPAGKDDVLVPEAEVYSALSLGLRDYVLKNGFREVVLGLSGGVDSALVAVIAADALGKENVNAVFMPSRYSSIESEEDAHALAAALGIGFRSIPIEPIFKSYLVMLEPHFCGLPRGIAEENLQARVRGNILMALSNKFGWLVLTTGNKSEMSTGYSTLYGDMAGGLAVIKDVPKLMVYSLCGYRNSISPVIPKRILDKAPSAELRPGQKDTDTLPPYETLDGILKAYVEEDRHYAELVALGFEEPVIRKVVGLVDKSEYKRRQSPPGLKITPKAFGRDRRMPITNRYPSCPVTAEEKDANDGRG